MSKAVSRNKLWTLKKHNSSSSSQGKKIVLMHVPRECFLVLVLHLKEPFQNNARLDWARAKLEVSKVSSEAMMIVIRIRVTD